MALQKLKRTMLRDDVYDALLEMLLTSQFSAGQSISIDSVARQLGVSPTPVREAMVQLEHTGLVSREALKGYSVAPPLTEEQIEQLADARSVLEVATTERAARLAETTLPELRAAYEAHAEAVRILDERTRAGEELSSADVLEYFRADWHFHDVLIRATKNRFLVQMASALGSNVHRHRQTLGSGIADAHEALAEHKEILDAIEKGDVAGARKAMEAHLDAVADRSIHDSEAPGR